MQDVVVNESLRQRGMLNLPYSELLPYISMERRTRILDKAPKRVTLFHVSGLDVCGTAQTFVMLYSNIRSQYPLEVAAIDVKGVKRFCDVEIYWTLQALLRLCLGKNLDRITAACDVFRTILTIPGDSLTKERVYQALFHYTPVNYYAGQLVDGIHVAVYGELESVLYWKSLVEFSGFYAKGFKLGCDTIRAECKTTKDVDKFCAEQSKLARADKDFMKRIYKPGANKYLIAMLYYLKEAHPEVIEDLPGTANWDETEVED